MVSPLEGRPDGPVPLAMAYGGLYGIPAGLTKSTDHPSTVWLHHLAMEPEDLASCCLYRTPALGGLYTYLCRHTYPRGPRIWAILSLGLEVYTQGPLPPISSLRVRGR